VSSLDAEELLRSGFVAVVGRPNVGKSTLVNALVGDKVAITSARPQTTRGAIRGVLEAPGAQVVLVDTPGYHKPRSLLGERLNEVVRGAWRAVDLALFVVDGRAGIGRGDERVARDLGVAGRPVVCAVNKVDVMKPAEIAGALMAAARLGDFEEYVPTAGRTGEGVSVLRDIVVARMPWGPAYYPPGTRRDEAPALFVAELVREKLLARMEEELPHSIAVVTEELEERDDGLLVIHATVFVERTSQKAIVVGKAGATIKEAGTAARREIEALFGQRVFLDLRVKVEPDWQRRAHALDRLGIARGGA
jgi:GTP-binding protein Era